jgi:phospholipase C
VCSQVFDHTSVLRFLETWTGVTEPNISPWRRAACGDLTSTLDFTGAGSFPPLPAQVPTSSPRPTCPTPPGNQTFPPTRPKPGPSPVQAGVRPGGTGPVRIDFANTGKAGAHFYVHAGAAARTDDPWRYTVETGKVLTDYWATGTPTGANDLTAIGPSGFTGNRVTTTTHGRLSSGTHRPRTTCTSRCPTPAPSRSP